MLATPHLSLGGRPRIAPRTPHVSLLDDTVAPRILDAMRVASARLKLNSPRPRDLADVMELIRLGIERDAIRADLVARSPELVKRWDRAVAEAWQGVE